ncbi:MAG: radical SAM family heme chaperone HemW [Dysgonamonadaceae bacterium]|jgi:oxygen-independent coproporphyrinogen-3 oxidase|nr:radical SAM family heme chaperone HemW [Dysgonamonadaceae bacterium]
MAGVYFHIPFCRSRCIYCDFFSSTSLTEKEKYVDALCEELKCRKDYLKGQIIRTVYFGGGTPSLLSASDFEKIFQTFNHCFPATYLESLEITLEANPDDITLPYLDSIKDLPFNRISLGIQSFNDSELQFLRRRHDSASAVNVVKRLQEAGFGNISIDLMYGLPGQTLSIWEKTLQQAVDLNVQHISAYHLSYEEDTQLFELMLRGNVCPVSEELSVQFFNVLIDTLSISGFEHYEISNFARQGYRSMHNTSYWNGEHYLGIGAAAHSYNGFERRWNRKSHDADYAMSDWEVEVLDEKTAYNDLIITGLRTKEGINLKKLISLFGNEKEKYCLKQAEKYIKNQMLESTGGHLRLTRKGLFVSDGIMSDLMI